jgi:hydroxymethylglutaryl-CoA reductase
MHLFNILNHFKASEAEKSAAVDHFKDQKVSFSSVGKYIATLRS